MDKSIAEIAGKLNRAERDAVRLCQGSHAALTSTRVLPFWTTITKLGGGQFQIGLNEDGRILRNYLNGE